MVKINQKCQIQLDFSIELDFFDLFINILNILFDFLINFLLF